VIQFIKSETAISYSGDRRYKSRVRRMKIPSFSFFHENDLDSSLIHHSLGIDAMRYRMQKSKIQKSSNKGGFK
jgi:hypothetical protein